MNTHPPDGITGRNLLLVTYSFPPYGGVGVHRALSLAKYLPGLGWNMHVLTARNPAAVGKDLKLLAQVPPQVIVHRAWTPDLPFAIRKALKALATGARQTGSPSPGSPPKSTPIGKSLLSRVVQAAKDILSPDPQMLWLPFAGRRAAAIVAQNRIDAVVITVPPFSTLRLAAFLRKRFPGLTIVADLRDEWLTYYFHTLGYNRSETAWQSAVRIERDCVESSDLIVMVTEKARDEMAARYPDVPPRKFRVVRNGFEPEIFLGFSPRRNTTDRVLIGYTGTVYAPADPSNLCRALDLLPAELKGSLVIRFIGHVENPEDRALLERHAPAVRLDGFLPQADAMKALEEMDFLLLIWIDTINIPGKLYDYLGTGKPILAFAHPEGEVWRLIEQTRAGFCADVRSTVAIARLLRDACEHRDRYLAEYSPDSDAIEMCKRNRRAEEYSHLLISVIESESRESGR